MNSGCSREPGRVFRRERRASAARGGGAPRALSEDGTMNDQKAESVVPSTEGRIGLDVGTSKILVARRTGRELQASIEVNAFIPLPYSRITENILLQEQSALLPGEWPLLRIRE